MKILRARQHGIGTLFIAAILLFIMSMGVLYANKNIIFEQRTSADQMKQTTAMEVAEAGLQWAIGMLNNPGNMDANCIAATASSTNPPTTPSFRKQYFPLSSTGTGFAPVTTVQPGCAWDPNLNSNAGGWSCSCPTTGLAAPTLSAGVTSATSFSVSFAAVASDPKAVQITSIGCTPQTATCASGATAGADANASVTAIVKASPLLPGSPAAALTCGTSCSFPTGTFNVVNTDVLTHGVLVNAGGTAGLPKGTTTLPGQPVQNALVGNDPSLSSLAPSSGSNCSNSQMFQSFFGTTLTEYASAPSTISLGCNGGSGDCSSAIQTAYNDGWRSFYFPNGFQYNSSGGNLGTPSDPVTLVTAGSIKINGNITVSGVVFSNDYSDNALGTGSSNIDGALVTCAGFTANGNGTVTYDSSVMSSLNKSSGTIVPVPGSWRDW